MPIYFRKRPGSKNIKANITQRGLRSFTLTSGGKRGEPRVNWNSSRGFSFSIPGTGLVWRQKGYGNSEYNSVVEERGYDLRTKEGKQIQADENFKKSSSLACVIVGAGAAWLFDSPHGLWAGYVLFWILFAIGEKSILTFIWAIFAHVGAAIGYALSFIFNSEPLELSIWGIWLASFLFSIVFRRLVQFLFFLAIYVGIWAFLGEPSFYFEQLPNRIGNSEINFALPNFNVVYPILNLYGAGILFSGILYYLYLSSALIDEWDRVTAFKVIIKIAHFIIFFLFLLPLSSSLFPVSALLLGFKPDELDTITTPIIFLMALGFSLTFGLFINRRMVSLRRVKTSFHTSFFQCSIGFFWLPLLSQEPSSTAIVEESNKSVEEKVLAKENSSARKIKKDGYRETLQSIWGLGEKKENALLKVYPTAKLFLMASDEEVSTKTKSLIGKNMAKKIRLKLNQSNSSR